MSHQRYTAALGSAAEERDFCLSLLQLRRIVRHRIPGYRGAGLLIVAEDMHVRAETRVNLHYAAVTNLQQGR